MLGFSLWGQTPTGARSDVELFGRFRLETHVCQLNARSN